MKPAYIKKQYVPKPPTPQKQKAVYRMMFILKKLQEKYCRRLVERAFGNLFVSKRKNIWKFQIISIIQRRAIFNAFSAILSYRTIEINKEKTLLVFKKLSISVLVSFVSKYHLKSKQEVFAVCKNFKANTSSNKIKKLLESIQRIHKIWALRCSSADFFYKLRQNSYIEKRKIPFFKSLNSFVQKNLFILKTQVFSVLSRQGFFINQAKNLKLKQLKLSQEKNFQLSRNQQIRLIKNQISTLTKSLQLEQNIKSKTKKQELERNYIIQAKTTQRQKFLAQLEKGQRSNEILKSQLSSKKQSLKSRQEYISYCKQIRIEEIHKKMLDFLSFAKTKDSFSLRELSIILQKQSIDILTMYKKFCQSKDFLLMENIDLRNMVILYEKQCIGYAAGGNVDASSTYNSTFQQNETLRSILELLFSQILHPMNGQKREKVEEIQKLLELYHTPEKESKITLPTLTSLTSSKQNSMRESINLQ